MHEVKRFNLKLLIIFVKKLLIRFARIDSLETRNVMYMTIAITYEGKPQERVPQEKDLI